MSVPHSVKNLLETQNVPYAVSAWEGEAPWLLSPAEDTTVVRSVLLKDSLGKIQVLFAANSLLDLNALNQLLVRELHAFSPDELEQFYQQQRLQSVPALPSVTGHPTVVDQRLFNAKKLLLDSGTDGQLLAVNQNDFHTLVGDSIQGQFSVPLDSLGGPYPGDDASQIFDAVRNFTSIRIKQRLEETLELPPLPSTAQRIIQMRVDPNADVNDLASIVETDPSLAAQVVSWAASPYYSAPGKIRSIHDAILRVLGFDMVLNLSLGLSLGRSLKLPKDYPRGVTPYWQQAVYTAAAMEGLVTAMPREQRPSYGMAYLSGLLNNFGFLVLAEVFPPQLQLINRLVEANRHVPTHLIERHILGVTREQLASWLMNIWQMPEEVEVALRYQQVLNYSGEHKVYAQLLYLANAILRQHGVGTGPVLPTPDSLYAELHLDPEQSELTIGNIMNSTEELDIIAQQLAV